MMANIVAILIIWDRTHVAFTPMDEQHDWPTYLPAIPAKAAMPEMRVMVENPPKRLRMANGSATPMLGSVPSCSTNTTVKKIRVDEFQDLGFSRIVRLCELAVAGTSASFQAGNLKS
jgi:hypothetical protein